MEAGMLRVNEKTREMFVYGQIGPADWGFIGADSIVEGLGMLGDGPVSVRVNSPGGSVDEAVAAVENLRRHGGEVTVSVDALAASAATLFLVSGFKVTAAPRAMVMIHQPHTIAIGDAASMRKTADILDKYSETLVDAYAAKMDASRDEILAMVAEETWFTAKEALAIGLVDEVVDIKDAPKAMASASMFRHPPQELFDASKPATPVEQRFPKLIAAKLRAIRLKRRDT
jgi:ATP-dependent protease ClpP protease subunit